jgi:hypothetical protein
MFFRSMFGSRTLMHRIHTVAVAALVAGGLFASSTRAATIYNLRALGGSDGEGDAINGGGQVAGWSETAGDLVSLSLLGTGGLALLLLRRRRGRALSCAGDRVSRAKTTGLTPHLRALASENKLCETIQTKHHWHPLGRSSSFHRCRKCPRCFA